MNKREVEAVAKEICHDDCRKTMREIRCNRNTCFGEWRTFRNVAKKSIRALDKIREDTR